LSAHEGVADVRRMPEQLNGLGATLVKAQPRQFVAAFNRLLSHEDTLPATTVQGSGHKRLKSKIWGLNRRIIMRHKTLWTVITVAHCILRFEYRLEAELFVLGYGGELIAPRDVRV